MSIKVECPGGHTIQVKDKCAGKTGKCPRCGEIVQVPNLLTDGDIATLLSDSVGARSGPRPAPPSESVLDAPHEYDESGLSLVGLSNQHYLPIKQCPRCRKKVHVDRDNVCPNCGAYFTYWE